MFYSKQEFYDAVASDGPQLWQVREIKLACSVNNRLVRKKTDALLAEIKKGILERRSSVSIGLDSFGHNIPLNLSKIMRPWSIVPALRDFCPPEGDFGIGVEIEYGFNSNYAAKGVMYHVRNWKHVALDREGGIHGVEATFPPILYSKLSKRDKPFRYLDFLAANHSILSQHCGQVGTHINVSAARRINDARRDAVNSILVRLSQSRKQKYFNRNPYGYINHRSENASGNGYVEMKLFNSTTCSITLRRYINIAVSLVKLMTSDDTITTDSVVAALEAGYNKRNGHPKQ